MVNKETEPIRILHVFGKLNLGGAESRVMDLYRHIDRTKVQFDFVAHTLAPGKTSDERMKNREPEYFDDEIRSLGGRIYAFPRFNGRNYFEYKKAVQEFFAEHHDWVLVEGHITSVAAVYLPIAKAAGVKVTAAHVRNAGVDTGLHGMMTNFMRRNLSEKADELYTCSKLAGVSVYGQKIMDSGRVKVIPNAIDAEAYRYRLPENEEGTKPKEILTIGHVGRFDAQKNHPYLIDVFAKLPENYRLMMIGVGGDAIREKVKALGLKERVSFMGRKSPAETKALYSEMDLFVFPSLYEGLPGVVVEAQAAGLPCIISDEITEEVCLTPLVTRLSLSDQDAWVKRILATKAGDPAERAKASDNAIRELGEKHYDVAVQAKVMEEWYLSKA